MQRRLSQEFLDTLELAANFYTATPKFPLGGCTFSQDLAKRTEAELVSGWWTGPKKGLYERALKEAGLPIPKKIAHFTVRDPKSGLYLDISAQQFMPELPRILILAPEDPRITTIGDTSQPQELYKVGMIIPAPQQAELVEINGRGVYTW